MKRGKKAIALLLAVLVCGNLFACGGKSRELGVPARAEALSHEERLEADYRQTAERAEAFAPAFAAAAYRIREAADGNVAVAPVSVFMAMSLAAVCAGGDAGRDLVRARALIRGTARRLFCFLPFADGGIYHEYRRSGGGACARQLHLAERGNRRERGLYPYAFGGFFLLLVCG